MNQSVLEKLLQHGLEKLNLSADANYRQKFFTYLELLMQWNRKINLTAIKDPKNIIIQHFFDSLSIHRFIQGKKIIDVGSGGGFPGLPLSLYFPTKRFYLLDSSAKRCSFLRQVVYQLQLTNVAVICQRSEQYQPEFCFDQVLCRAYAKLGTILQSTQHLLCRNGQILAMKAKLTAEELADLTSEQNHQIVPLAVPFLQAERSLVVLMIPAN
ncbi:MAG: 16S rRNA (guanine(527)-N(7))-methyltransferase RsmG [Pseudomonadota bacterium]